MTEYTAEIQDGSSGHWVTVTAKLYDEGHYDCYSDPDTGGDWVEIVRDPMFYEYTYEDQETGAIGVMPEYWKELVDSILVNIYWDRELNR